MLLTEMSLRSPKGLADGAEPPPLMGGEAQAPPLGGEEAQAPPLGGGEAHAPALGGEAQAPEVKSSTLLLGTLVTTLEYSESRKGKADGPGTRQEAERTWRRSSGCSESSMARRKSRSSSVTSQHKRHESSLSAKAEMNAD